MMCAATVLTIRWCLCVTLLVWLLYQVMGLACSSYLHRISWDGAYRGTLAVFGPSEVSLDGIGLIGMHET